jgi:putative transposase
MARKTQWTVEASAQERTELESLIRRGKAEQRLALRARIILMGAGGAGLEETGHALGITPAVAGKWRRRWGERAGQSVEERLADVARSGAPAKFTAQNICAIMALACEPPEASGRPITHWSQNELAAEAVKRQIVPKISQRSVGRFLKSGRFTAASQPVLADAKARRAIRRKGPRHL